MAITPIKALLFLVGGTVAAAATAYVSGSLNPYLESEPGVVASLPDTAPVDVGPKTGRLPGQEPVQAAPETPAAGSPAGAAATPDAPAAPVEVVPPGFDVVRVQSDGSIVIAGNSAAKAKVEIVIGSKVIGEAVAGADGDFVVVLEKPLEPGDYQIVLRSTTPDNVVATSVETAVVSIPDSKDGQVLALVEEPGKPAEMISVPKPEEKPGVSAAGEQQATGAPAAEQPASSGPKLADQVEAAAPDAAKQPDAATGSKVSVEAVEIEGRKIFVAGVADAGRKVRGYANDILLGETQASPDGRFLIEAERDLPVGDYIIRVDALEPDGVKVTARAAVPFEREPGEAIAAIAPPAAPAATGAAASGTDAAAGAPPASQASAPDPAKPTTGEVATGAPAPAESPGTASPPATAPNVDVAGAPTVGGTDVSPPAAAMQEVTAPKLQSVDSAVIIRRGDTLWRISRRVYGRGVRYSTIYLANQQQISDPDQIWPGQVFKVPEKTTEGEAADMTGLGDQVTTSPQ